MKLFFLITLLGISISGSTAKENKKAEARQEKTTMHLMPGML